MQQHIWKYLFYTLLLPVLYSCENEIDVTADWEEVAVIYGALNPTSDTNYIRINRAYLDENQSALRFINNPDSLYFDSLDILINEYRTVSGGNKEFTRSISTTLVDGNEFNLPKDSGFFYSETNPLYQITDEIFPSTFITDYEYELVVTNPKTGYTCLASTISAGGPEVRNPVREGTAITVTPMATEDNIIFIEFQEGKHVRAYSVRMDIRIEEFETENPSNSEIKTVQWTMLTSGRTKNLRGFSQTTYLVSSSDFFATISSQLKVDEKISRRLLDYDLHFYGITDDFDTYLSVSRPSIGIVQKKPEFTNIENGLGLFSSRHIESFRNKQFVPGTTVELNMSKFTSDLNFVP